MVSLLSAFIITFSSYYFVTRHAIAHLGQYKSITGLYSQQKFRKLFRKALWSSAIFQIIFINFLNIPTTTELTVGRILFSIGALAGIALVYIPISEYFYSHGITAFIYIVGLTIGAISTTLALDNLTARTFIIFPVGIWLLSIPYFLLRKNGIYKIELSHMIVSYLWLFGISIYLL